MMLRYKTKLVKKGYFKVKGVDFSETFSKNPTFSYIGRLLKVHVFFIPYLNT